jgi:hypothetical protein
LFGRQGWFGVHDEQEPERQKRFVPHPLPSAAGIPVSTQTGAPVEHEKVPR